MAKLNKHTEKNVSEVKQKRVPLTVTFEGDTYARLHKLKKRMGLPYEQDVIRLAVAYFLEKNEH